MVGARAEPSSSSADDGSSLRIALELLQLRELLGLRELGAQALRTSLGSRAVLKLALDVVAQEQDGRCGRAHIQIPLQERSRLQIVLALVRKLHHARERIGEPGVPRERLAVV